MKKIDLYDTTLRDGTQMAGISLSVEDKLKILARLDQLGVTYVEGGWPGSNPKDSEFFRRARSVELEKTILSAFGMTRRPFGECDEDANLKALVESGASVACIVGKASAFHVERILEVTLDENLKMVEESIAWLRAHDLRVLFDAEHFFDGHREDSVYAARVLQAARDAGAEVLVLCDTNGGTLPHDVEAVVAEIVERFQTPIGAHFHNDSGCGVANSLAAVRSGASHIQGCVNGFGERCGNADLLTVAANLEIKMGIVALGAGGLAQITDAARFVAEVCNVAPDPHAPFAGNSAFSHKGGLHVAAVLKDSTAYEHTDPSRVGNQRDLLASDLAGVATLKARASGLGLDLDPGVLRSALGRLKELEALGFTFEAAGGSLELLLREQAGWTQSYFKPLGFRAIVEDSLLPEARAEATVRLEIAGRRTVDAAEGHGPVDALSEALRAGLARVYPEIGRFHLTDYKVRVLDAEAATAARVRVLIETTDGSRSWTTIGVSENIIEASWVALIDSIVAGFIHLGIEPRAAMKEVAGGGGAR